MPDLFDPYTLRGVTLRNRIGVSPMCEYSAEDGMPNDWHFVHLGARAVGGAGLIITKAAAVEARGRITAGDAGIWTDAQAETWAKITRFLKQQGAQSPAFSLLTQAAERQRPVPGNPVWASRTPTAAGSQSAQARQHLRLTTECLACSRSQRSKKFPLR